MKLTLVGHSCWLVETRELRILFDPLLYDPNQCDCYEIHPTRHVDLASLPDVDMIVVSHRHIDHFDVRSLCSLRRSARVLCPQDRLITDALSAMGFGNVHTVSEWESLRHGTTTLIPTPSTNPVPEYGFLILDGMHSVWNQVDTQLAGDTADTVNRMCGRLDVVIAPWQPLLELKFQLHESIAFPHREYADLIARAARCATRVLVPGACGLRYVSRSGWLNRLAFPVARRRFVNDIRNAISSQDTVLVEMDPGDEVACDASGPSLRPSACASISSARGEDGCVAFCPVDPFQDLFREGPSVTVVDAGLSDLVDDLDGFIQREVGGVSSVLAAYTRWQVVYQLIVCLDEGNVFVSWDFDRGARRSDERNMLATATCLIRDATLRAMAARVCSWEEAYHSGQWRFFQSVARIRGDEYAVPASDEVTDLLQLRYPYARALDDLVSAEVARWKGGGYQV